MRLSTYLAAGALALGMMQQAGAAELRFAHTNSPQSYGHMAAEKFAEIVAEKTNGDLTIGLYPAGQLGGGGDLLKGARLGTIDITMNGNPWYTGFNAVQNVLDLPFIFDDHAHVYRALDGEVGEKIGESLEAHGLKLLAFWEIGFRNVINSKRPVKEPADLAGLKIRTTGNKAHISAFELLGANPQPLPFGEVYLALQTNVIDGTEHPVNEIYEMKFQEVTDNLSLTNHAYTAMVVTMNLNRWKSLSEDEQTVVMEAAKEATDYQRALLAEENVKRLQLLKDAGMAVVEDPDREAFRAIVYDKVKADYEAEFGDELTTAIEAAR
ncbi:TRAP transporter substrate-binding protein [Acuticoccus sp. M5D2P5]|uniref:TRAP transporter substrate-binding protein n=1 Tax=Acuticoccus kalidii TaxID=2910977 RepID=UPI001F3BA02E|nr:TRAP transporter substrate-binding protein [Acuticoccus kalidii]MCF3932352.1 TRAP transporter substrate-binding protein [Acuticoccus kalidii]